MSYRISNNIIKENETKLLEIIYNGVISAVDSIYMNDNENPILKPIDTVNIALAIHDSVYIELKKDLERIALLLEGIYKEMRGYRILAGLNPNKRDELYNIVKRWAKKNRPSQTN